MDRSGEADPSDIMATAQDMFLEIWADEQRRGVRRVINATGVVIHTNLGRAPLSAAARRAITDEAAGYCTLEYDLATGKRGRRGRRAEELIIDLTGAGDALIVNNCAAAAFFVLTVFAAGGEVIISRGELVEIGGDFRVPDVLDRSGAVLKEVGTTNRTKIADYEKAIGANSRMILRVHPSNYRIVGFTAAPNVAELAALGQSKGLMLYEDLGSGALIDLSGIGLTGEPFVRESLAAGADVVTFSGDKLLGGPQAGIIAGKAEMIERLRKHPLYRALRVDKLSYAALAATLEAYRRNAASAEIPVQQMLAMTAEEIGQRAESFVKEFQAKTGGTELELEIIAGTSAAGGGAAPQFQPPTRLLALSHSTHSAADLEKMLRVSSPPVISRIADGRVMFDLRTVSKNDESELLDAVAALTSRSSAQNPA
jgi:L-seryl-tRNA(Ser) seleniumtransferase